MVHTIQWWAHLCIRLHVGTFSANTDGRYSGSDAAVGVHKFFLRLELLGALHLVQNTTHDICESTPGIFKTYVRVRRKYSPVRQEYPGKRYHAVVNKLVE